MIRKLYFAGASDADICEILNISEDTYRNWKKNHPELKEAMKARDAADAEVVNALFERAIGFESREVTLRPSVDEEGNPGDMETVRVVEKTIAGDVAAQKFWLTNRDPEKWANREQVEHYDANAGVEEVNKGRERVAEMRRRREAERADGSGE